MTTVKLNNKEYTKKGDDWFSTNKKGIEYKVLGVNILKELNDLLVEEEIDLNAEVDESDGEGEINLPEKGMSGFGDLVSKVTNALGIDECDGCEERKKKLNDIFPFNRDSRLMTEDEIKFIKDLNSRTVMSADESKRLFAIYNEITKQKVQRCTCPGLHKTMIQRMYSRIDL